MQQYSPEDGFVCPSGCISPEACVSARQIRVLDLAHRAFLTTIQNPGSIETIKAVHGDLNSISVQGEHLKKQSAALYEACGLYRLQADGLITEAVDVSDMPPLD